MDGDDISSEKPIGNKERNVSITVFLENPGGGGGGGGGGPKKEVISSVLSGKIICINLTFNSVADA